MKKEVVSTKLQNFINALAEGHGVMKAGEMAGYTTPYRDALPYALAPAVREMCRKHIRGKLDIEASPVAYRFLMWVLQDEKALTSQRVEVAKFLLSHSVAAPKAKDESEDNDKEPSDMSTAELREYLAKLNAESVKRGELIDATPMQVIDDII